MPESTLEISSTRVAKKTQKSGKKIVVPVVVQVRVLSQMVQKLINLE